MDGDTLWKTVLTGLLAMLGFFGKARSDQLDSTTKLLNATREEMAGSYVTRAEYRDDIERLGHRLESYFQRLEDKIDALRNS